MTACASGVPSGFAGSNRKITGVPFGFAQGKLSTSLGMTERKTRDDGEGEPGSLDFARDDGKKDSG
jgi:hypothetical protein